MQELPKYQPDNEQVTLINSLNERETIVELWHKPIGRYTVRAGANSNYSYTEFIPNITDMQQMRSEIIEHHKAGKVFY